MSTGLPGHDVPVIVGSGLAGLVTAWALAPRPCIVLAAGELGVDTASAWAQGGLAAAVASDDDPALHAVDTLAAGSYLGDPDAVRRITGQAPGIVSLLLELGVPFDRREDGSLALGLEGGHGRNRIVHVDGDRTGAGIMRTLVRVVRALSSVTVLEHTRATALELGPDGAVSGVQVEGPRGPGSLPTRRVVLATGGAAAIYRDTTNPLGSHGHGIALAARAGAALADLEFVQFHPTALDVGRDPMPLLTEALRGAGGLLLADGRRFVDELAPRDVVAAAVWNQVRAGRTVRLDVRHVADLPRRFGGLVAVARQVGLDPLDEPLPVRPAAHYHMGGVVTDRRGRTDVPGLWAAGEVARTGLHGANRLASNSLLEAAVTARAVAADLLDPAAERATERTCDGGVHLDEHLRIRGEAALRPSLDEVRRLMTRQVGVLRDEAGLSDAMVALTPHLSDDHALVGWLIARAALARPESVGGHLRSDAVTAHVARTADMTSVRCPA